MGSYDTSAQWQAQRGRLRAGIAVAIVLIAVGSYFVGIYLSEGVRQYGFGGSIPLLLGLFALALSIVPISHAFSKRQHPVSVEVGNDALRLVYHDGTAFERKWTDAPVAEAHDYRKALPHRRRQQGLEVTLFVPIGGTDPNVPAIRPQELVMSGRAFDDIMSRMEQAGHAGTKVTMRRSNIVVWDFKKPSGDVDGKH